MFTKIFFAICFGFGLVFLTWYFINTDHSNLGDGELKINGQIDLTTSDASFTGRGTVTRLPDTILAREEGLSVSDQAIKDKPEVLELATGFYKLVEVAGSYAVYYDAESGAFTITLAGSDTKSSRLNAESYLLSELPYTKEEWCKFDLTIATNAYEEPRLGGINLGLSFCPGSVEL